MTDLPETFGADPKAPGGLDWEIEMAERHIRHLERVTLSHPDTFDLLLATAHNNLAALVARKEVME